MSQGSEPSTPGPSTPDAAAALFSIKQNPGQWPQEVVTSVRLLDLQDILYDLQQDIHDAKADVETNGKERDFMALPPFGDANDDSVSSVGGESQFSVSSPQAHGVDLKKELTLLCILRENLSRAIRTNGEIFFSELQKYMIAQAPGIQVYGNQSIVATLGQNMLVPMLSFYGIATKDVVSRFIKPKIGDMKSKIKELTCSLFTTPAGFPDSEVDCTMPTAANMVWNVRLKLNGNIFTLLTFRVVAMNRVAFEPQIPGVTITPQNYCLHLLFALLSKACAKDFNCLCAMPEIDVALFKIIAGTPLNADALTKLAQIIKIFLELLADPQLQSKRSYMITALHNLVSCLDGTTTQTGETLAYKKLFDGDVSGSGLNTFNPIMIQISQVIQILRSLGLELQVSLCGGRMIYKLSDVLRSYITQPVKSNPAVIDALGGQATAIPLLTEMEKSLNLPSDSDYTLTFAGLSGSEPEFVQTILMFITFCTQLGIKRIVDDFCTSQNPYAAFFLRELVVIGMSLVGGDFQLSSARNSCNALAFLDEINTDSKDPSVTPFLQQFARDHTKSFLAPCDLVPKMNSGNYIVKISTHIFDSGYVDISPQGLVNTQILPNINTIAERISRYSMSTDQGFSSPIKVLFDIFFTLFSIENFTNRAFVTQKINKELKRIAICASILFFHFQELLQMPYPEWSPERQEITTMLQILGHVINYGYNPEFKLISDKIDNIMTAYASCFVQLLHLYHRGVVFYSQAPGATLPVIGIRDPRLSPTSLELKCMDMLKVHAPPLAQDLVPRPPHEEFHAEGLSQIVLHGIITTGVGFLNSIQKSGILANFLRLKQHVKAEDLAYKSRGEFLTSVQACETFLKGFVRMLQPPSTLLTELHQLLEIFSNPEFAEIMHFQPVVVIKSENLTAAAKANPATAEGLKVSAERQFCIYALLSIFGVKFKSEWSKISLFTRILFYELLSMNMQTECSYLLGVDFTLIDPVKLRFSSQSYLKDKTLYDSLVACGINPNTLPSLGTYYGNDKLYHGIETYKNRLLDTGQVKYSFISPFERTSDDDVLSFQYLSSQNLQQLMMCSDPSTGKSAFYDLLQQDALQPRAYELLLKRLTDKFSILTKKCDNDVKQELTAIHGGRSKKELRMKYKLEQLDGIVTDFVSQILQATPEQRDGVLIPSFIARDSTCFEGEKVDIDKFEKMLETDKVQCQNWIYHLLEMIIFYHSLSMVHVDLRVCVENIKKYSKLLFLLKNYLPIDPVVVKAAIEEAARQYAAIEEAARQYAAIEEAARQEAARQSAAIEEAARQQEAARQREAARQQEAAIEQAAAAAAALLQSKKNTAPGGIVSSVSHSVKGKGKGKGKGKNQGGGSPKASRIKTKSKSNTMPNRYSKNARTRKNKHKCKQPCKYKKKTNTKNNNKKKLKSKNVTFKRRKRSNLH